jgi:hypothetical protein
MFAFPATGTVHLQKKKNWVAGITAPLKFLQGSNHLPHYARFKPGKGVLFDLHEFETQE